MSQKPKLERLGVPANWKELGWKSEADWVANALRIQAQHKAQAKAAGIPWK